MPLSTSNSNDRLPALPWGRLWLLTILLAVVCLGSYEMLWRWRGFVPMPRDDVGLWMLQRNKIRPHDREQVVILGASQSQSDYELDTFEHLYGSRPVQLAVFASSCLPVLDQLARDETFQGIVVADVVYWAYYDGMYPSPRDERQQHYVNKYDSRSAGWWLEGELGSWVDQHLVFRQYPFSLDQMLRRTAEGRLPTLFHSRVSQDREQKYNYPKNEPITSSTPYQPLETVHPHDPTLFYRDMSKLRERVDRITKRGGKVIFVVLPMAGYGREYNLKRFPREQFFDRLVADSGATGGIHFMDYAGLRDLVPPDGSHLDQTDMVRFTETFVGILKEKLNGK